MGALEHLEGALASLEAQRERLDSDIEDLRRMVREYSGEADGQAADRDRGSVVVGAPGSAREAIARLITGDRFLSAREIAERRGTSVGATKAALYRMLKENGIGIESADLEAGRKGYRIRPPGTAVDMEDTAR